MLVKLVFNTTKISLIINGVQFVRMLKICSLCLPEIVVAVFLYFAIRIWCVIFIYFVVSSVCGEPKTRIRPNVECVGSVVFDSYIVYSVYIAVLFVFLCQCCGISNENRQAQHVRFCMRASSV